MSVMNKFNKLKTGKDYMSFDYEKTVESIDKEIDETSSKLFDLMYDLQRLGSGVNFKKFNDHQDPNFLLDYLKGDLEVKELRYKEIKDKLILETFNRFHDELWFKSIESESIIPTKIGDEFEDNLPSVFEPFTKKETMEKTFWKRHGYEVPKITLFNRLKYLKVSISMIIWKIKYKTKTFLKMLVPTLPKKVEVQ